MFSAVRTIYFVSLKIIPGLTLKVCSNWFECFSARNAKWCFLSSSLTFLLWSHR